MLAGPRHTQGGIQLYYSRSGYHYSKAIINRHSTALFLPVLDYINSGGRPLAATMPGYALAALGAITWPVAQVQLQGAVEAGLDYQQLAQQLVKVKSYTRTTDTVNALQRHA